MIERTWSPKNTMSHTSRNFLRFRFLKKISLKPVDSQKRVCYQTDVSESYSVVCSTPYLNFWSVLLFSKKFTVLLVPEGTARVKQFRLPRILPVLAILLLAGFTFLGFGVVKDYLSLKAKAPRMTLLEAENALQQKQLIQMASRIDAVTLRPVEERSNNLVDLLDDFLVDSNQPCLGEQDRFLLVGKIQGHRAAALGDNNDALRRSAGGTGADVPVPKIGRPDRNRDQRDDHEMARLQRSTGHDLFVVLSKIRIIHSVIVSVTQSDVK